VVALGLPIADPLIGLGITFVILKITWAAIREVSGDRLFVFEEDLETGLGTTKANRNNLAHVVSVAEGLELESLPENHECRKLRTCLWAGPRRIRSGSAIARSVLALERLLDHSPAATVGEEAERPADQHQEAILEAN
jgi:Co/Zn/Cd efflux system component